MPAIVVIVVHAALAVDIDDPVRLLFRRKHFGNILMTTFAVRVAVIDCVVNNGRIDEVILIVVHVHIVDACHFINDIECALQGSSVVLEHGAV